MSLVPYNVLFSVKTSAGEIYEYRYSSETTLLDVLLFLDTQEAIKQEEAGLKHQHYVKQQFLAYDGKPSDESFGPKHDGNNIIRINYNVIGVMQPVLTINSEEYKNINDDLSKTTLHNVFSKNEKNVIFVEKDNVKLPYLQSALSFLYTTDHVSHKDAVQQTMMRFKQLSVEQHQPLKQNPKQGPQNNIKPQKGQEVTDRILNFPTNRISWINPSNTKLLSHAAIIRRCNELLRLLLIEQDYKLDLPIFEVQARVSHNELPKKIKNNINNSHTSILESEKTNIDDVDDEALTYGEKIIKQQVKEQSLSVARAKEQLKHNNNDSDVPSSECEDSDDDSFYVHNKQDYKVLHKLYISNHQKLKNEQLKAKKTGKVLPYTVLSDDESDTDIKKETSINNNKKQVQNKSTTKMDTMMQSLLGKRTPLHKKPQMTNNTIVKSEKNEPIQKPCINSKYQLPSGEECPAAILLRITLPTIFVPLSLLNSEYSETNNNLENKNDAEPVEKLHINSTLLLHLPSTLTLFELYFIIFVYITPSFSEQIINNLHPKNSDESITSIIKEITSLLAASQDINLQIPQILKICSQIEFIPSTLDMFPFVLNVALPPTPRHLTVEGLRNASELSQKTSKPVQYPMGLATTLRDLKFRNRSAVMFQWKSVYSPQSLEILQQQQQPTSLSKNVFDIEGYILKKLNSSTQELYNLIKNRDDYKENILENSPTRSAIQTSLVSLLKPIYTHIDEQKWK